MYAAVIIGLTVLLIPSGHCRPRETSSPFQGAIEVAQFLTTSTVHKRQNIAIGTCDVNQVQDIFANYPQDCVSALGNLDLSGILNGNPTALIEAFRIICQPRCGNPILTFYSQCGLSQFVGPLRGFCSRNADGTFCYEDFVRVLSDASQVESSCNLISSTNCSMACQNSLNTFVTNSGCCINVLNNTATSASSSQTLAALSNSLWSRCGVNTPGFCNADTSTLSSAETPYFVKALMLLTLVVMAILLL